MRARYGSSCLKMALATPMAQPWVWLLGKCGLYLHGREEITVQSDHKPLIPIFRKPIHKVPKRLQGMLLRLQKYNLKVEFRPGVQMHIANWLSKAYLETGNKTAAPAYQIFKMEEEDIRASESTMGTERKLQSTMVYILYKGMQVIIPITMRQQMLEKIHASHLGAEACKRRAKDVLFWPGMAAQISDRVDQCDACNAYMAKQQKETMISYEIPTRPWKIVSQDLFSYQGETTSSQLITTAGCPVGCQ